MNLNSEMEKTNKAINKSKPSPPFTSEYEFVEITDKKTDSSVKLSASSLKLLIHHHKAKETQFKKYLSFFEKEEVKDLVSLKLVIFDCLIESQIIVDLLNFQNFKKLKHLKLNFGNINFNHSSLKTLKKRLKNLKLETFHLSLPNADLEEDEIKLIDEKLVNFEDVKDLKFNFLKVMKVAKSKLSLKCLAGILCQCSKLNKLTLNLSQNLLGDLEDFQSALLKISELKLNLRLSFFSCKLKQKNILAICDTLLKFENLEGVKLDIRENYKAEFPTSKVISYCETLICAFRHMLAEGDDKEEDRKYKVCY